MSSARPTEHSRVSRFFARHVLGAMDGRGRHRLQDPERLVHASGISSGARVLEIGSGSGFFTPALAALVGPGGAVEAIDKEPMAVEVTAAKLRALGLENVRVSVADAHATDFPDASFDAVLLYGVVPAPGILSEPRLALELQRILKPGGLLAIWTVVPLWTPRAFTQSGAFAEADSDGKVHRLLRA